MFLFKGSINWKLISSWTIGFLAFLWIIARSGLNPKRLAYPCQQASLPIATSWMLAVMAFLGGSLLLRKFVKYSGAVLSVTAIIWFVATIPKDSFSEERAAGDLPEWKVAEPISKVFVMDEIPATSGSLNAGDVSVPDEYLNDPAIDTLFEMMAAEGIELYKTALNPDGIVGAEDVVVIKANLQWTGRNTTSTDRIKGLIWQILQHPDGFTGEIIVCDNTQDNGTGINHMDNNSEDITQSIVDVTNTFYSKGYPVYLLDWNYIWDVVADEYSEGDLSDGYVYEASTKITYSKFLSPSGNYYLSMRYGVWDNVAEEYDLDKLCLINFPVLKAHVWAGSTIAVKNWIGLMTTAHSDSRYGNWNNMHNTYYFGPFALVARVLAVTWPKLSIVDAAWTARYGPYGGTHVNTRSLAASTDPVAVSWYMAKYVLTPIADIPGNTHPDAGGDYCRNLGYWRDYLVNTAGISCTKDSAEMSVIDRFLDPLFEKVEGEPTSDGGWSFGVSWVDYDDDSYPDIYVNNYDYGSTGEINYLYHNNGNGTYTQINDGVISSGDGTIASTWADFDGDNDIDCYTSNPLKLNYFYSNDGGGSFTQETSGPLGGITETTMEAVWIDYDNDGNLDLFVVNHRTDEPTDKCDLYYNSGDGFMLADNSDIGLIEDEGNSAAWGDYDNDRDEDLFWSRNGQLSLFFENNGDGSFVSVSNELTVAPRKYHGNWADYDNDGDLDIYLAAGYPDNIYLHENTGDGDFALVTGQELSSDVGFWTGGYWGDFDNDGFLDLYVLGHEYYEPHPNRLYHNNGDGTFSMISDDVTVTDEEPSSAGAWADHDRDGDLDLYVANVNGYNNTLYENQGNFNGWIQIKCKGTVSNRSAIGTKVRLKASIGGEQMWQLREISAKHGFMSQSSYLAHFGLGDASIIDSILVQWPSGLTDTLSDVSINQFLTIFEGDYLDPDEDGVITLIDNCPDIYNPGQEDDDDNGIGNVCDRVCGDANNDEMVNILDIIFIINFKYKDGPAPDPLKFADVNNDLSVNILDIVYLINFKYKDGPDPVCP